MHRRLRRVIQTASKLLSITAAGSEATMQDYARPGELDPLPPGMASLYRVPWRAHARTVSAHDALRGVGVGCNAFAALPASLNGSSPPPTSSILGLYLVAQ